MLVISNNLQGKMPLPADAVIRVNLAWSKDRDDAERAVSQLRGCKIFLDYPQGRTKPPKPVVTLDEAIALANKYEVAYFAVSNIESHLPLLGIKSLLHIAIQLVPKIESMKGVNNMSSIIKKTGVQYLMLDKEDLWTSCGHNQSHFDAAVQAARNHAQYNEVHLLELQGVVFT